MKEDLNKIFGRELRWFAGLAPKNKLKMVWFVVSFCLLLCLRAENCHAFVVLALALNLCASAISLRSIPSEGLEE